MDPAQFWGYGTDHYGERRDRLSRPAELTYIRLERKGKEHSGGVFAWFLDGFGLVLDGQHGPGGEICLQETGKVMVDGPADLRCLLVGLLDYCDCHEDDERARQRQQIELPSMRRQADLRPFQGLLAIGVATTPLCAARKSAATKCSEP